MYYIVKTAVYDHGVFGIFEHQRDAEIRAHELALADIDNHHAWKVKLSGEGGDLDLVVYTTCKSRATNNAARANG